MFKIHLDLFSHSYYSLVAVELTVKYLFYAAVRDQFKTIPARRCRRIYLRAVDGHAVLRGLDDRVRLGMDRGYTMTVLHVTADLRAMRPATDTAVITSGEYGLVLDDHCTDMFS